MAWQHFYSRVPARVSMYNKADGFDTFAHSNGLEREFIERELSMVYENKLGKNDVSMVRKGEVPHVYTQCCTRSGILVQNCISYLPLDYTGERSAYLSHSLIFSPEEKSSVLSCREDATLNPALFTTDIGAFDITSPTAVPNDQYPEVFYISGTPQPELLLLKEVDPETAKAFLYAILYSLCGKGKNVFFKLSGSNETLSVKSVQLFNEVLSILPYQLRGSLSFVSHINDATQYANFKLKGVSAQFPELASGKGVYFDLQTNLVVGLHHDEVVANKPLLNFFYSLLENQELRNEFLGFMECATAAVPSLQNLTLKTLNDLVFLFQQSCGLFPEQAILPNDTRVYDYLCVYDKYRAALSDAYRMQAYKCLLRYPQAHTAIPKNIFAKVSRLYPTELAPAKRIVMNIVLELIHTDIMRDKLFTFIRNNYDAEEETMKQVIISDLCRVFYGGFLQNQLLAFFSEGFEQESTASKTLIVEKLLLSIRTAAVQGKILNFIDQHYQNMDDQHKDLFYQTFFEMLPECDQLADALIQLVNRHVPGENEARKAALAQGLEEALERDYRKKEHRLLPTIIAHQGFCQDVVIGLVFGCWQHRKLHTEYLQALSSKPVNEKTTVLARVFALIPELPEDAMNKLLSELPAIYQEDTADLFVWLETSAILEAMPDAFAMKLQESVFLPAVCKSVCDVFAPGDRTNGMELLMAYAAQHPAVMECEDYQVITAYHEMIRAVEENDLVRAMQHLDQLLAHPDILPNVSDYIGKFALRREAQGPEAVLCLEILQNCLKNQKAKLDKLYANHSESLLQQYYADHGSKTNAAKAAQEAAAGAMQSMLSVCRTLCQQNQTVNDLLCQESSGLEETVRSFISGYGKGAAKWLQMQLAPDTGHSSFTATLEKHLQAQTPAGNSFLSKLFGGKK